VRVSNMPYPTLSLAEHISVKLVHQNSNRPIIYAITKVGMGVHRKIKNQSNLFLGAFLYTISKKIRKINEIPQKTGNAIVAYFNAEAESASH
jgi:hypothetical protein